MGLPFLLIGGLVVYVVATRLIGAHQAASSTDFQVRGIKDLKYDGNFPFGNFGMTLEVEATNPSNATARIDNALLIVKDQQGRTFARIDRSGGNLEIPPRRVSQLEIPIDLNTQGMLLTLGANFLNAAKNGGFNQQEFVEALPREFKISGSVRINGIQVPVNNLVTLEK